jgi:hypothetical protein
MARIPKLLCILVLATSTAMAAGKAPEIQIIDGKVSIQVEAVPLGRLLRLLDQATGLSSKVPPELANRPVSARFSGLDFDAAVRKIFEGQPYDYIFVSGKGIVVTALTQTTGATAVASGPAGFVDQPPFQNQTFEQPVFDNNNNFPGQQQPPAPVVQTPFGVLPAPVPTNANGAVNPNGVPPNGVPPNGQPQQPQPGLFGQPAGGTNMPIINPLSSNPFSTPAPGAGNPGTNNGANNGAPPNLNSPAPITSAPIK